MKKQFYIIDVLKYFFCLGIVALHTSVLDSFGNYEYWVERGFVRLGVPFFFMVSGFMLESKISKTGGNVEEIKGIFKAWSKRLILPLVVFEIFDLITNSTYRFLLGDSPLKIVARAIRGIIFYPGGALWYLQACLVGIWIIYFFLKRERQAWIFPVGGLLYAFALICNNYYFLVQDTFVGEAITLLLYLIASARNGFFYGFLFLALGMLAYRVSISCEGSNGRRWYFILLIACLLYFVELIFLQDKIVKDDGSLFITLPLVIFSLLVVAAKYTSENTRSTLARNLSTGVYLLHCPVRNILQCIFVACNFSLESEVLFLLVILISHVVCVVIYKKNQKLAVLIK